MGFSTFFVMNCIIITIIAAIYVWDRNYRKIETFGSIAGISLTDLSTRALDLAPSTSEIKDEYKKLLLFAHDDIQKKGTTGLRILSDLRSRLFGDRNFRQNLTKDDFISNWPSWLPPMDPTITEPIPDVTAAVGAESRILAYLQKNYPQEQNVDEQTGSVVRGIIEDFGFRFVFDRATETVELDPNFLRQPLLKNWVNPTTLPS
jgi:hypothetical protein